MHRVRFVCISDTHNLTPKLPAGDVLIHAGDLTNQGSLSELRKALEWIEKTDFQVKIVVAGNHDVTLHQAFYAEYGSYFHNQAPQDPDECRRIFEDSSVRYLNHEPATITLEFSEGKQVTFQVFGSPYSPSRGLWAFGYGPEDAEKLWTQIPLDSDIVVTHTPPKYHCDEHSQRGSAGCEHLRGALWRVRPRLHVCGHVHEGRGAETVKWDLTCSNVQYKEEGVVHWEDPTKGTRKQFKIDLTSRGNNISDNPEPRSPHTELTLQRSPSSSSRTLFPGHHKGLRPIPLEAQDTPDQPSQGRGGPEGSGRVDKAAVYGRTDRRETCIINAAIVGSNFPHKGGKKINDPIVVDIPFPVVEGLNV